MNRRLIAIALVAASTAFAQQGATNAAPASSTPPKTPGKLALTRDEIAVLARTQVTVTALLDSANVQRSKTGNKKAEAQLALTEKLKTDVAEALHHAGLSDAEFRRRTFLVSTDTATRRVFDSIVVAVTGAPLPGQVAARPVLPMPPGQAGVHIGHLVNSFAGTPDNQGLLVVAGGEARIAAQHAGLAGRQPGNLDYMKLHAGHVIHALDPTVLPAGPGMGYGLKRAIAGVAQHIELAGKAEGASPGVVTHSQHIATSAKNTLTRVDHVLELAQKVRNATTAEEAAALVSQMASAADQLIAGVDANGDGRITWEAGEGGLQACEDHTRLMLAAGR